MTRARALKQVIRARAAKTGERYTTARRHVLAGLDPKLKAVPPPPIATRSGLSDVRTREKTGHGLAYWFGVLDRFGGVAKGHTALARHVQHDHGVPSWYAQGITVAFERARGARAVNQRSDGEYAVSVTKVIKATTADLVKAVTDARQRKRWTATLDPDLVKAMTAGIASPAAKGFVVRPDGQARCAYKWGATTVQIHMIPKGDGKLTLAVTNAKLADAGMVEERRALWRTALNAIAQT